jgi:anti-sigma regulatory factor (Ser/Thr protein kinase)
MGQLKFYSILDPAAGGSGLILARDGLRTWLSATGMPEVDLDEVLIAAGEACANAVEHSGALPDGATPAAWITATSEPGRVRVVVSDRGRWKEPIPASARSARRGRGRSMMAALVDHLEIRAGSDGTIVELIKERR